MMRMALLTKFSFPSLGSACELKLELEIDKRGMWQLETQTETICMKKGKSTWKATAPWLK